MRIHVLPVGPIGTNCYFLVDEASQRAAIIDPGDEWEVILKASQDMGVTVEYLLLTHGHYDHTTAVPSLHKALPHATIFIHQADAQGAGSYLFPLAGQVADLRYYDEGDTLPLGQQTIEVLHTPGHSPGSVTLKVGDILFCGDTLFAGSCGRTDLNGGSYPQILQSLKRLAQLPGNYQICPGHDRMSTLDAERQCNPFLREALALP